MSTKVRKRDWFVGDIGDFEEATHVVEEMHYSKGAPNTATYLHGLFRKDDPTTFWGVAWWLPPIKPAAVYIADLCGADWRRVLNLSRLVVHPDIGTNGASFLLGGSERLIRKDGVYEALVTYADTLRGHTGQIYKATNWDYDGMTRPQDVWVDQDGRAVSRKRAGRTRRVGEMRKLGFTCLGYHRKHRFYKCL
jgi:hypothetical protein